jgi:predicted phage terminase large subunit-like protein
MVVTEKELAAARAYARYASECATREAEQSLAVFTKRAWEIIEPETPLQWNWHLDAVCLHLQAVADGLIKYLLINVPPGTMKSILISVMFNAWVWTRKPHWKFLATAYGDNISTRDNLKVRQVVTSDWYQSRWGDRVQLASDQNVKTRFNTTRRGFRIGVPLKGGVTGEHPHIKIVDDPHNTKTALSVESRKSDIAAFQQGLSSRGAALNAATIVTMQRLNQGDLSGWILDSFGDRYTHLCFPMRYEPPTMNEQGVLTPRMKLTPLGFQDPRTEKGELLWPALFPEDSVRDLELALGDYGAAGQLQQRPSPEQGGLFKREWFSKVVDVAPPMSDIAYIGRGWDNASTDGAGDWTVGVLIAITHDGRVYILDVVRDQIGAEQSDGFFTATTQADLALYGRSRYRVHDEEEGGSSGKKVTLARAKLIPGVDYVGERPTGEKSVRARPFRSQCAVHNVYLVKGQWNKAYIDEFVLFPGGNHDDQVDATSGIYNSLYTQPRASIKRVKITGV